MQAAETREATALSAAAIRVFRNIALAWGMDLREQRAARLVEARYASLIANADGTLAWTLPAWEERVVVTDWMRGPGGESTRRNSR